MFAFLSLLLIYGFAAAEARLTRSQRFNSRLGKISALNSRGTDASCSLTASGGDDAPAFLNAVKSCDTTTIPLGTTLSIATPLNMSGLQDKHISVEGTIRFTNDTPFWSGNAFFFDFQNASSFWILGGNNIILDGGGTLDGQGQAWYDAFASNSTLQRPIILTVFQGTNVTVDNVHEVNSPFWTNLVWESSDVTYNAINISATSSSSHGPSNTDGWDIYRSDKVVIQNSVINNGDDCVSFKPNSTNILVQSLQCTGSHGISVGSLGQFAGVFDIVENVTSTNITMTNTENGARIKAWAGPDVGSGIVKNITFDHFFETKVDNPIIIDQCYMTDASECAEFPSNTFIQDIFFNSITGTSSGTTGASLACSPDGRCDDINLNNITVMSSASSNATFTCQNVNLTGNAAGLFGTCATT
ncbi:glycoside hydrolase family 28 protein [Stereum hirsutum FP-91666 SS1]|uniref:glycoside hydrolase family 28 protein n=1 Tax=Stereum hirsutum (strain FP-91666) TaxID=721885 RepID=UPI000444A355|nr:glycoside hydrolase family 28 protein [Stereum hirsutum FP-91666 SS1]EIM80548.1 glycoside hydrolase family 28 protein [Stereum hirsutum FP-91666 SS1]